MNRINSGVLVVSEKINNNNNSNTVVLMYLLFFNRHWTGHVV